MTFKFCFLLPLLFFVANIYAQEYNTFITDEETGEPMLIGTTTREAFDDTSFSKWWYPAYDDYDIDISTADSLKDALQSIDITVVMGTWCSDSRYEIPELYKIFDYVNYSTDKINLICVDRDKNGKTDEVDALDIELVPTIIFYEDENELGRIVEMPKDTMEKDMLKILVRDDD